jgi:hypothetical protein
MWDFWWKKWHWDRFLPEYFGFSLVSFIPLVLHYFEKWKKKKKTDRIHHWLAQYVSRLRCYGRTKKLYIFH